ncbi:MAG: hypothetical protein JW909_08330 [Planctomycetes bacterium]|nr:hypothetical protein [Planctomycetota bacterium]
MTNPTPVPVAADTTRLAVSLVTVTAVVSGVACTVAAAFAFPLLGRPDIFWGALLGASAGILKSILMAIDLRRLAATLRPPGFPALLATLGIFGAALFISGMLSLGALVSTSLILAAPYAAVIIVSTGERSADRSKTGVS